MSYIEVKNASVIYNEGSDIQMNALLDVDLKIEKNEFVIFFGPSGCGKTTLLNLISGLEKPSRGQVFVDGDEIANFDANQMAKFHCNKIGMVFQAYNLILSLSVIDNVILPRIFLGDSNKSDRKKRARELLEKFGVLAQENRFPMQLSGGQQQRIGIARSLINEQPIILADEPVGNLDSKSAENVLELIKELNEKEDKTIIMVTHNAEHLTFADHIFYIKDGKITQETFGHKKKNPNFGDLEPEEKEFELLSRSFVGLNEAQLGMLIVPFKAKVLAGYSTNLLGFNQRQRLEELITRRLSEELDSEEFRLSLDLSFEKGGVGLDFRTAKDFSYKIEELLDNAKMLQVKLFPLSDKLGITEDELRAKLLVRHFAKEYVNDISIRQLKIFERIILKRLNNEIDNERLLEILDASSRQEGAGLDVRVVRKISQELEVLLLLKFSQNIGPQDAPGNIIRSNDRHLDLISEDLKHIEDLANLRT